jgi:hypothetical protein
MKLLVTESGVVDPKTSQEIKKKKTKKGNDSSKNKTGGIIKKTNKDEGRMFEATGVTGMKVSNIIIEISSFQKQVPDSEEPASLH